METFDGLVISLAACRSFWAAYSAGRDLDQDPYAVPLAAPNLSGLPPALVILGGCDMLRDEGRAYAARLRDAGVPTEEVCYPGQPHGFVNFEFPAAAEAFARIGSWTQAQLGVTQGPR
jgi:acetyl esterase